MLRTTGSYSDILSWSGYIVLRFSDGEGKSQKGKWCNFEMVWWAVHSPAQPVVLSHPSLLFHSHDQSLHPARFVLPVLFPAITQWRHGAVGDEQHTSHFCASLSFWLVDNVKALDDMDKTAISHVCVCVCVAVLWMALSVWACSDSLREGLFSVECQCVSQCCAPQRSPSPLKAAPGPLHSSLCSQKYTINNA